MSDSLSTNMDRLVKRDNFLSRVTPLRASAIRSLWRFALSSVWVYNEVCGNRWGYWDPLSDYWFEKLWKQFKQYAKSLLQVVWHLFFFPFTLYPQKLAFFYNLLSNSDLLLPCCEWIFFRFSTVSLKSHFYILSYLVFIISNERLLLLRSCTPLWVLLHHTWHARLHYYWHRYIVPYTVWITRIPRNTIDAKSLTIMSGLYNDPRSDHRRFCAHDTVRARELFDAVRSKSSVCIGRRQGEFR